MKVVNIYMDRIIFDNEIELFHYHPSECCENHYLDFNSIELSDFDGLEFDLLNDSFFERIPGYGIALIPLNGHPIRIAGYGENNGYYSSDIQLILMQNGKEIKNYDISECQDYEG